MLKATVKTLDSNKMEISLVKKSGELVGVFTVIMGGPAQMQQLVVESALNTMMQMAVENDKLEKTGPVRTNVGKHLMGDTWENVTDDFYTVRIGSPSAQAFMFADGCLPKDIMVNRNILYYPNPSAFINDLNTATDWLDYPISLVQSDANISQTTWNNIAATMVDMDKAILRRHFGKDAHCSKQMMFQEVDGGGMKVQSRGLPLCMREHLYKTA